MKWIRQELRKGFQRRKLKPYAVCLGFMLAMALVGIGHAFGCPLSAGRIDWHDIVILVMCGTFICALVVMAYTLVWNDPS